MEIFDLEKHLEDAKNRKILDEEDFIGLCDYVLEILVEEPTVCAVSTPVTICGDVHGQFYDLLQLFKMGGQVPFTKYVFMGDYVDRGYYSLETLCLLICLKARYPDRITLLRGNHESRQVSQTYGFYDECKKRYGNVLPWQKCMEVFDCLPVAAVVDDTVLCVHGGLSPDLKTLDQIRVIPRRQEIPQSGGFSDLMWSDPDSTVPNWVQSQRGAGYLFGERVTREFNHLNSISLVCRAHQLVMEGYKHSFSDSSLVTIWSAPNYCYRCGNVAAIMQVSEKLNAHFVIFSEVPESMREIPPTMPVPYFM